MPIPPHCPRIPSITIVLFCTMTTLPLLAGCVDPPPNPLPLERGSNRSRPPDPTPSSEQYREVSELLSQGEGRVSVAVADTAPRVVFAHAGQDKFELASVAKVYILAAYLDKLAQEVRGPSPEEFDLMQAMIEYSDNKSATSLFHAAGGADGINAFLDAHGLSPVEPASDGSWGSMRASPVQVAGFLARLYTGEVLDVSQTSLAFALLANVVDEQAWGVGAARDVSEVKEVYLKNGWLPGDEGWIVNSVGLLRSTDRTYVVVFMSDRQPDFEAAVHGIEKTVALIRTRLFGPALTPTSTPDFRYTPVPTPESTPAATRTPTVAPQPGPSRESTKIPVPTERPAVRTGLR
jgi:hypothetical protein